MPGRSQNKWLSKYQRRASQLRTGPSPTRGREAGGQQPEPVRGNLGPRDSILHQTVSRPPVAKQVFLGSWTVDICQEGCSQRSAPQRRHMACLRWCSHCTPRKLSIWDRGGYKIHRLLGESALAKHLVAWAALTREGHKTQAQLSLCLCGVPKNLNLSSLDLGSTHNSRAHLRHFPWRSTWSLSSIDRKSTHAVSGDKPSGAQTLWALPIDVSDICLQCSSLLAAQLNKWA